MVRVLQGIEHLTQDYDSAQTHKPPSRTRALDQSPVVRSTNCAVGLAPARRLRLRPHPQSRSNAAATHAAVRSPQPQPPTPTAARTRGSGGASKFSTRVKPGASTSSPDPVPPAVPTWMVEPGWERRSGGAHAPDDVQAPPPAASSASLLLPAGAVSFAQIARWRLSPSVGFGVTGAAATRNAIAELSAGSMQG